MTDLLQEVKDDIDKVVTEWLESGHLNKGDLFVIGCSTSEVAGSAIGTSGSEEIAAVLFDSLSKLTNEAGVHLIFQCCEHLNRALVMEKAVQRKYELDEVSVVPVPTAGGSMASFAFKNLHQAVIVESVSANAGIDIGDTLIGMHLRQVAVPLRFSVKEIASARMTSARTRPKLIGGERAKYA